AGAAIRDKRLSPVELTDSILGRIDVVEDRVSAFSTDTEDIAVSAARRAAHEIAHGRYRGLLHGIPFGLKGLFKTAGVPTTASSMVLADFVPDVSSAVTDALIDAGAVLVGMTHTHEFAYGSVT